MQEENRSYYDLEKRTFEFASAVRKFARAVPYSLVTQGDLKQVLRSSGSIGANYIEANESLSHKDFLHRTKISRKEAKETQYWLGLLQREMNQPSLLQMVHVLLGEVAQLIKIFSTIITNAQKDNVVAESD